MRASRRCLPRRGAASPGECPRPAVGNPRGRAGERSRGRPPAAPRVPPRERAQRERRRGRAGALPPPLRTSTLSAGPGSGGVRPPGRRPAERHGRVRVAARSGRETREGRNEREREKEGGRPTAVRRARGAASERETPRRGRGLRRVVPSDRPPPGGFRTGERRSRRRAECPPPCPWCVRDRKASAPDVRGGAGTRYPPSL